MRTVLFTRLKQRFHADPARAAAFVFLIVGCAGGVAAIGPTMALFGLLTGGRSLGALVLGLLFAVVLLGYAQVGFYLVRTLGRRPKSEYWWWTSTTLYNVGLMLLVPAGVSRDLGAIGAITAWVWFGALSILALHARDAQRVTSRSTRPT